MAAGVDGDFQLGADAVGRGDEDDLASGLIASTSRAPASMSTPASL
jgi:hypothetical protein